MKKASYAYIAVAALLLLIVGSGISYLLYRSRVDDSERYGTLYFRSVVAGKARDVKGTMSTISLESKSNYRTLAQLQLASAKISDGDMQGAADMYKSIVADRKAHKFFVEYATYLLSMLYAEVGNAEALEAVPTGGNVAFGTHIAEIKGFFAFKNGDTEKASQIFKSILADHSAPAVIRKRVSEMNGYLGSAEPRHVTRD